MTEKQNGKNVYYKIESIEVACLFSKFLISFRRRFGTDKLHSFLFNGNAYSA